MINQLVSQRYEVVEKIGEGPLFTVYRARDRAMNRMVALKVVVGAVSRSTAFIAGLQLGMESAQALDHPNIAAYYESGDHQGTRYLVVEFVRGINLKERIRRIAPFTLAVSIDVACALTEALLFAHKNGQVHGDVRPHNIIMSADGAIKVTDFGVMAGVMRAPRAESDALARSAPYRAPELFGGASLSPSGDIYAVGVILYEMLTGSPVYSADSVSTLAELHATAPIPLPRVLNAGVPRSVEGIIVKCLQKRPDLRYPSTSELLADLKSVRDALRFGKPLSWSPIDVERMAGEIPPPLSAPTAVVSDPGTSTSLPETEPVRSATRSSAIPFNPPSNSGSSQSPILGSSSIKNSATSSKVTVGSNSGSNTSSNSSSEPVAVATASSQALPMPTRNRLREDDERIAISIKIAIGVVSSIILGCILVIAGISAAKWVVPESVVVPQMKGKTIEEVRKMAEAKKIHLIEHPQYSDTPRGVVLRTDADDISKLYQGHDLNVWYSKGPTYVDVPNVVGLAREEAEQKLKDAGLTVGKVIPEYNAKIPANHVIAQDVSYKKKVLHDQAVGLVVSDGPMPDNGTEPGADGANSNGSNGQTTFTAPGDSSEAELHSNPNPPDDPGNTETHEFKRNFRVPKDGKGRRKLRIEVVDANGLSATPIDNEEHNEDDKVPLSFSYSGKKIRLIVYYDDKLSWSKTFDPVATERDIVR